MKILIIGNIGSGKTTLGKKIQEYTGFVFIQIDEFRKKVVEKKVSEEYYCLYEFIKVIEETDDVILEFTGAGCHKYAIKRALELSNDKTVIIYCQNRNFSLIADRVKNKELNDKFPFDTEIEKHIIFIKEELDKDSIEKFWNIKNSTNIAVCMDTFDDLKDNTEKIIKLIKEL